MTPVAGRAVFGSSGRKSTVPVVTGWPLYLILPETGNRLPIPSFGPQPLREKSPAASSVTASARLRVRVRDRFRGVRMEVVSWIWPFDWIGSDRSVRVGADALTAAGAAQRTVGDAVDAVLEELDRAVAEE